MRLGALVGACNAQLVKVVFSENTRWKSIQNKISGDKEYKGASFLFYGTDEVLQNHGTAYFHNFNTLANLLDSTAGTPNSENPDANIRALQRICMEIYAGYKSQNTFREPASTPFKNDYSAKAFSWIYKRKLCQDLQASPDPHAIFLRKLLEFYDSFSQQLAQDGKVSEHAGMFPFQKMATDLFRGLTFMSTLHPDKINPLIGDAMKCLISFHCASSELCASLKRNSDAAMCDFQEHFDSLHELAVSFESLYDSFNEVLYTNPKVFEKSELALVYTVGRFNALISMMHASSLMGYKMSTSGSLMADRLFLDHLSKLMVHVILSSLKPDTNMSHVMHSIDLPSNGQGRAAVNSIKQMLSKVYCYIGASAIKNDLGFDPADNFELTDIPEHAIGRPCSQVMLKLSSKFFKSTFTNSANIQMGNSVVYNDLIRVFAAMCDLKAGSLIPFQDFVRDAQYRRLLSTDFEGTGTFPEIVASALRDMDAMVPAHGMENARCSLEVYAMLDSIVRFSGAGSLSHSKPLYPFLIDALERANKKKLKWGNQERRKYRIILGFLTLSFIVSCLLLGLLMSRAKTLDCNVPNQ